MIRRLANPFSGQIASGKTAALPDGSIQLLLDLADRVGRELADFLRGRLHIRHRIGRDALGFLNADLDAGLHLRRDRINFLHAFPGDIAGLVGIRLHLRFNLLGLGLFLEIKAKRDSRRQNDDEQNDFSQDLDVN